MTSTPIAPRRRRRRTAESSPSLDIPSLTNSPKSSDDSISPRLRRRRRRSDSSANIDNPPELTNELIAKSDIEDGEPRRRRRRRASNPDISDQQTLNPSTESTEKNIEDDSVVLSTTNKFVILNSSQIDSIRSDLFQDFQHSELAESNYY